MGFRGLVHFLDFDMLSFWNYCYDGPSLINYLG